MKHERKKCIVCWEDHAQGETISNVMDGLKQLEEKFEAGRFVVSNFQSNAIPCCSTQIGLSSRKSLAVARGNVLELMPVLTLDVVPITQRFNEQSGPWKVSHCKSPDLKTVAFICICDWGVTI